MAQRKHRIADKFRALKKEGRKAFVAYVMAGDPDLARSAEVLAGLPQAGADIIELGIPFTDPMADGAAIQAAALRALSAGTDLRGVLQLVRGFREKDDTTPLVLMGYYNPIYRYGVGAFLADARQAGVDGLIVVDLPPEEDDELCAPSRAAGLDFIRLITPTTDDARLPYVLRDVSGFIYYVSITGTTGAGSAQNADIASAVARIRAHSDLPIAVGFGIRTPQQASAVAGFADGVVVGTALVEAGQAGDTDKVLNRVAELAQAIKN